MKKDEKNEEKKRMNPWFYAIFWLSRQKLARIDDSLAANGYVAILLDHRGIVTHHPFGALAHLGLARA